MSINNNVKLYVDGRKIEVFDAEIKLDTNEKKFNFNKVIEGTLENVQFSEEFLKIVEKQRKLHKMKEAREKLYKYID